MVMKMEITSMSSRGQVVIPQAIREQLGLVEGEKLAVICEGDTVLLKKIPTLTIDTFNELLRKTHEFAREKHIKPSDVRAAIRQVRHEGRS